MPAARAQRRPHRGFAFRVHRARQLQIRQVHARDQQNSAYRRKHKPECAADARRDVAGQGGERDSETIGQTRGNAVRLLKGLQLGARLLQSRTGFEPRNHFVVEAAQVLLEFLVARYQGCEDCGLQGPPNFLKRDLRRHRNQRKAHARRQHTNDRGRLAPKPQGLSNDVGIALKVRLPTLIAQQHHVGRALFGVLGDKVPAQHWLHSEHAEKVRRSRHRAHNARLIAIGRNADSTLVEDRRILDGLSVRLQA